MDASAIADLKAELGSVEPGGVWPRNVPAVLAFLAAGTQWRTGIRFAGKMLETFWIGLDYSGARVAIEALEIEMTPEIWSGVGVMEVAARDALNGD
jgi:hypothetical protein